MTNVPGERPLNNPPEPDDAQRAIREAERILGVEQPDVFEILAKLEPHLGDQPAFRELVARMQSLPPVRDLMAAQEMHVTGWMEAQTCGRCGAGPTSVTADPLYWRDTSGAFCTVVCKACVGDLAWLSYETDLEQGDRWAWGQHQRDREVDLRLRRRENGWRDDDGRAEGRGG